MLRRAWLPGRPSARRRVPGAAHEPRPTHAGINGGEHEHHRWGFRLEPAGHRQPRQHHSLPKSDEYQLGAQIVRSLRDQKGGPRRIRGQRVPAGRSASASPRRRRDNNSAVHVLPGARRHHQRIRAARRLHRRELRHRARLSQRVGARGCGRARNRARHSAAHGAHVSRAGHAEHRADRGDSGGRCSSARWRAAAMPCRARSPSRRARRLSSR